ncbi:MAG: M4 family metallopeptidase [Lachnospiraceae bacterium]|nr:M4 family metallopeptidase [Lachnospiraceae bacterium]
MAHEFTHALTTATMTLNIYQNDYGAINEGFSDIFGNLVEVHE